MKTIKLRELVSIQQELEGLTQGGNVILKGLLSYKMPVISKFTIHSFLKANNAHLSSYSDVRNELITEYGEMGENGNVELKLKIGEGKDEKINDKYLEFEAKHNELLNKEVEVDLKGLNIELFKDIETDEYYSSLFNLLDE